LGSEVIRRDVFQLFKSVFPTTFLQKNILPWYLTEFAKKAYVSLEDEAGFFLSHKPAPDVREKLRANKPGTYLPMLLNPSLFPHRSLDRQNTGRSERKLLNFLKWLSKGRQLLHIADMNGALLKWEEWKTYIAVNSLCQCIVPL
jgi:hypothetical protein